MGAESGRRLHPVASGGTAGTVDMNALDFNILLFVNGFARHSLVFDKLVTIFSANVLFKGGVVIPVLWWLWFRKQATGRDREYIISLLFASFFTIFVARAVAFLAPFRARPMHNPALHFVLPYAHDPGPLIGWSAFPSDHAALFFTLATGIFLLCRPLGCLAFLHALLVISFPRIYLGVHHPTDIVAGALVGIAVGVLIRYQSVRRVVSRRALALEESHPGFFYVCFFFVSCQMVLLFDPLRSLASDLLACFKLLS